MAANIHEIVDEHDFDEKVFKTKEHMLIGFYMPWCESCKITIPRVQRIVEENFGKLSMAKVNMENMNIFAIKYNIKHVPVIAIVKDGKVTPELIGIPEEEEIRCFVDDYINGKYQSRRRTSSTSSNDFEKMLKSKIEQKEKNKENNDE